MAIFWFRLENVNFLDFICGIKRGVGGILPHSRAYLGPGCQYLAEHRAGVSKAISNPSKIYCFRLLLNYISHNETLHLEVSRRSRSLWSYQNLAGLGLLDPSRVSLEQSASVMLCLLMLLIHHTMDDLIQAFVGVDLIVSFTYRGRKMACTWFGEICYCCS